jgi:hypothetical protein
MSKKQWIANLAVFPFVCIAIALFLAVNYVIGGPNHDPL